ncbi:MAG: restriction endonuclease subunit S [Chloracidobacterium sp.]|nr:restriction endonuclease subunit S [Chloracidobacterium sp.]
MTWKTVKFGEVCRLINGKAFKPSDWSDNGLPIIRIQNLNDPAKGFNYWNGPLDRQVHVENGDVLLAWSGTPGTSFGAHLWNGPIAVLNQHIFLVELDPSRISKAWAVSAVNYRLIKLIDQAHGGVGLQHVTKPMVENLEIPLPPLDEQKRIAGVLNKADALRQKRRLALQKLDTLLQSVFLEMFGDPETNLREFEMKRLEDLTTNITDGKHGDCRPAEDSGYYFVSVKDIKNGRIEYRNARQIEREDFLEVNRRTKLEAGDVLITNSGTIGKTAVAQSSPETSRTTFQKSVAIVKPIRENLEPNYLKSSLDFCVSRLSRQASGSSQKNLLLGQLRDLMICVPPIELQNEFAARQCAIERHRVLGARSLDELEVLFQSIQVKAFSGELFSQGTGHTACQQTSHS